MIHCMQAGECAKCHSDNIEYSEPIIDEKLTYPYVCNECHAHGEEVYDIDFSYNSVE